ERDVALGPQDTTEPAGPTPITADMTVKINRVKVVELTQTDVMPFDTQTIKDPNVDAGTVTTKVAGENGQKVSHFRVHYMNGVEDGRSLLSATVTLAPVTQVTVVGTKIDYTADPVKLGQEMAAARGWIGDQWTALYQLWMHESGWNPAARNASSGAC